MVSPAVSACSGSTAVLTSEEGTVGINKTQYKDNMMCKWRIVVKTTQVTHFIATHYVTCSFELDSRRKIHYSVVMLQSLTPINNGTTCYHHGHLFDPKATEATS